MSRHDTQRLTKLSGACPSHARDRMCCKHVPCGDRCDRRETMAHAVKHAVHALEEPPTSLQPTRSLILMANLSRPLGAAVSSARSVVCSFLSLFRSVLIGVVGVPQGAAVCVWRRERASWLPPAQHLRCPTTQDGHTATSPTPHLFDLAPSRRATHSRAAPSCQRLTSHHEIHASTSQHGQGS